MGRRSGSDEETTTSSGGGGETPAIPPPHDRRPVSPPHGAGRTWIGGGGGGHYNYPPLDVHEDGFEDNYFRRRPKSFCMEGRRFAGVVGGGGGLDGTISSRQLSQLSVADETYLRSLAMVGILA